MISWLQKKHKYMMVAMWISGLSFIAAGFVGWGSYSFKSDVVKKIGEEEITQRELKKTMNFLKDRYSLTNEEELRVVAIKTLGLSKMYKDYLRKNEYSPQDVEILDVISNIGIFQDESGKFNKDKYFRVLADNRVVAKEYEDGIREDLYREYIESMFENIKISEVEVENISKLYTNVVNIEYTHIPLNDSLMVDKQMIEAYYNENKEKYKNPKTYTIEYFVIEKSFKKQDVKEDELAAFYSENNFELKDFDIVKDNEKVKEIYINKKYKKQAQLEYIKIKKGKFMGSPMREVVENNGKLIPKEELSSLKLNKFSKPIYANGKYYVVKVEKINQSQKSISEVGEEIRKTISIKEDRKKMLESLSGSKLLNVSLDKKLDSVDYKTDLSILGVNSKMEMDMKKRVISMNSEERGVLDLEGENILVYRVVGGFTRTLSANELREITSNMKKLKRTIYLGYFNSELTKGYEK